MTYRKAYLSLICLTFLVNLNAQISQGGKPFPYFPDKKSKASAIVLKQPDIQKAILKSLSEEAIRGKKPLEFAWNHEVDLSPENSGYWTILDGGIKIWRLVIVSPGAYAVNVYFGKFRLRNNCMLFAYSPDQSRVLGGFNEKNNLDSGVLPLAFIPGESIVLELQLPNGTEDFGEIEINSVAHDFINVFGRKNTNDKYYGASGACNIDIACPEGADWQIIKNSVCRIAIKNGGSTILCSGALINTTHPDTHPYLITANHCIDSNTKAQNSVFYFDYESESCRGPDDTVSVFSLSGSRILATSDSLDFSLLKLSSKVPLSYNPYYAGWTNSTIPASNAVCIHHPEGDVKKISLENDPVVADYQSVDAPSWLFTESVANGFWRIRHWEKGTTEGGSSGAPVFNQNKKIVGNLTGGNAYCGNSIDDYFSKFFLQWNYYPDSARQLKCWLDSLGTGLTELNGNKPIPEDTIKYSKRYVLYPNPASDLVTFETDSLDIKNAWISIFNLNGVRMADYMVENEKRINLDVSFLIPGLYILEYKNNAIIIRRRLLIIR